MEELGDRSSPPITRADCEALDAADPLGALRERFDLPAGVIYLDGNSLGPLPRGVAERMRHATEAEWGRGLIGSWDAAGWIDLPARCGTKLGPLLGVPARDVFVGDSTSVNLFKIAWAARQLVPHRPTMLTDTSNFPTDSYVLSAVADASGANVETVPGPGSTAHAPVVERLARSDVGVVALSQVDYRSGHRYDLGAVTEAAHAHGAVVVWDLAHSVGAMAVDLVANDVDFAVGCGYKFLNGGPGAPGFAYVAARHQAGLRQPLQGWMGHREPFDFAADYEPAPGAARLGVGTPAVLSMVALDAALDAFDGVEPAALRAKSERLTQLFVELVSVGPAGAECAVIGPSTAAGRGSHVALRHADAVAVMSALIEAGVIGDVRGDVCRFGFAPLYTRFVDVWDAAELLGDLIYSGRYRAERFHRPRRVP